MSVPELLYNYPADGAVNLPVGEKIVLAFSNLIDTKTARDSIILVGKDYDRVVGAAITTLKGPSDGFDSLFLKSPGFSGTVPLKMTFEVYDIEDPLRAPLNVSVVDRIAETAGRYGSLISIVPEGGSFAPNLVYTLYVNGDTEATGLIGVSARTVYDVVPDPGNSSTTGTLHIGSTWTGDGADTIYVKVTTDGDPGSFKYKWWYDSLGESSAKLGLVSSRKYRKLEDGLQIRFTGSDFVVNDIYSFTVFAKERMADSFSLRFTTNDGSWEAAPAVSSVPASTVPSTLIETEAEYLEVLEMDPEHTSYNVRNNLRIIRVYFSHEIDPDTINEDTLKLWKTSVDGHYQNTYEPKNLRYEWEVNGTVLTIKF